MTAAEIEVPKLSASDLPSLVSDGSRLQRGTELFAKRALINPARHKNKLFGDVKGSEPRPYKVTIAFEVDPPSINAACTCPDAMGCPVCKHAAALLVAWSRAPETFAESAEAPTDGSVKVKEGKTTSNDVIMSGVDQVDTLLRELGVSGVAACGKDRIDQIKKLGDSLRDSKLRRLSSLTMDLAHLLDGFDAGRGALAPVRYADLVADLLLTVKKLGKYVAGEPLEDRYVEELIGRQWKESDGKPVTGLRLVEVAFSARQTTDDFMVRESRFVDVLTGRHYSEEQAIPVEIDKKSERKVSYAATVLEGAAGAVYPGFAPLRLKLYKVGKQASLGADAIRALVAVALPDVAAALAAFQEHRRDVFAPDLFPVAVRAGSLFARGPRLEAVDAKGDALHLCDEPRIEEQLGDALHEGALLALIGDLGIEAAIPTLWPLAAVIEGPLGIELRTIHDEPSPSKRSRAGAGAFARRHAREPSSWAKAARAANVSAVAIAVGEAREELADCLVAGLAGMSSRALGSLVPRLRDLGFDKPAALLEASAKRPDAASRLEDVVKIYQALGMILVRLAGATRVDVEGLARVPGYESLHVAKPPFAHDPADIDAQRARGALNRYEAVLHYARHFEGLAPSELDEHVYPTWADGSTGPYIARAFAERGLTAVEMAERVLADPRGRMAKITAIRVLQVASSGGGAGRMAEDVLERVVHEEQDATLRALAGDALDRIDVRAGRREAVEKRRAASARRLADGVKRLLTSSKKPEREAAITDLCELGHRGAIHAIRQAFVTDATLDVHTAAAYALARLGDTYMVEAFLRTLASRRDPHAVVVEIDVAARSLGILGDVRGLGELLAAYAEGYSSAVLTDAIKAFGCAALDPLLDLIERRPEIRKRSGAKNVLENLPAEALGERIARRVTLQKAAMASDPAAFTERADLYLELAEVQSKSRKRVAKAICEELGASDDPDDRALLKRAQRALGIL